MHDVLCDRTVHRELKMELAYSCL